MTTKLDKLLQKEAQLKAQIQQAKAAERTLEKKRDTRRKILIGAAVMARVESGRWPQADLLEMMDGFLTRPNERDLFGLDAAASEAVSNNAAEARPKRTKAGGSEDKTSEIAVSTSKQKAEKSGSQKAGSASSQLSEPDFDVDKEFNL